MNNKLVILLALIGLVGELSCVVSSTAHSVIKKQEGSGIVSFNKYYWPVYHRHSVIKKQEGSGIVNQAPIGTLSPDLRVDRGLVLSGHNLSHLISLQTWELAGLPKLDRLSNEAKLKLAIQEFRAAINQRNKLEGYTLGQVYAFMGRTFMLLGSTLQTQSEQSSRRSETLRKQARTYFEQSFRHYRLALSYLPEDITYSIAEDLVQATITSGDLNRALTVIDELERKKLKPNPTGDYGLLRFKADIYWIMGRYADAGLAYEEWIRRGNAEPTLSPPSLIYERLAYLKKEIGHPNNLPSKADLERR